ncbi:MAG: N-acetyltransferase [Candidatus Rokubacteria bacterium]|nr:N-acetyltransferase [Candidatus Rokubacteria bacterium]
MITVREERPEDESAIRDVNAAAFGRAIEGDIVDRLRKEARPYVGLVAVDGSEVVGHIAFSEATLYCYNAPYPIVALGPMAVRPARQRGGIGSALVRAGLEACRRLGHDVVVVLGHPDFYPRFGFVPGRPVGVMTEYDVPDDVFLVAELSPGALRGRRGVVYYAAAFR